MNGDTMTNIVRIETTQYEKILRKMWDEMHEEGIGVFALLELSPTSPTDLRQIIRICRRNAASLGLKSKLHSKSTQAEAEDVAYDINQKILEELKHQGELKTKSAERMTGAPDLEGLFKD